MHTRGKTSCLTIELVCMVLVRVRGSERGIDGSFHPSWLVINVAIFYGCLLLVQVYSTLGRFRCLTR